VNEWFPLLINPEVVGNIIGALLGFLFGAISVYWTQRRAYQRDKSEITYAKTVEVPLRLA
jgi:hypothetical protein